MHALKCGKFLEDFPAFPTFFTKYRVVMPFVCGDHPRSFGRFESALLCFVLCCEVFVFLSFVLCFLILVSSVMASLNSFFSQLEHFIYSLMQNCSSFKLRCSFGALAWSGPIEVSAGVGRLL